MKKLLLLEGSFGTELKEKVEAYTGILYLDFIQGSDTKNKIQAYKGFELHRLINENKWQLYVLDCFPLYMLKGHEVRNP
jgi:hypothetical protein